MFRMLQSYIACSVILWLWHNVDAATFLLLGGGIVLATSALNVVAYLTPCEWDDRLADVLTPLSYFAHFVIMIWGSVVIFGNFRNYEFDWKK